MTPTMLTITVWIGLLLVFILCLVAISAAKEVAIARVDGETVRSDRDRRPSTVKTPGTTTEPGST